MATIYLIRHGQASFGQQNYDQLSPLGEEQASHLGGKLLQRLPKFDSVSLGTMLRHQQTAELCLAQMGTKFVKDQVNFDDGWNEYDHLNILTQFDERFSSPAGMEEILGAEKNPVQAFEKMFNDAISKWMSGDDNSGYTETWVDFKARVKGALKNVTEQDKEHKHRAVFTSGGPISLLSQALLGVPEANLMQLNWTLVNCGITKLVNTKSRTFVATLNEHVHFEGQHSGFITYK